jgi:hypothetical protein
VCEGIFFIWVPVENETYIEIPEGIIRIRLCTVSLLRDADIHVSLLDLILIIIQINIPFSGNNISNFIALLRM